MVDLAQNTNYLIKIILAFPLSIPSSLVSVSFLSSVLCSFFSSFSRHRHVFGFLLLLSFLSYALVPAVFLSSFPFLSHLFLGGGLPSILRIPKTP